MLNHCIDFNIKYQLIVANKLPIEFKKYIRDIYIKIIAMEIIKKFISKSIIQCIDCEQYIFKTNSEYINACSDAIFDDITCCNKIVCKKGCTFYLKCGHKFKVTNNNSLSNPNIELNCTQCSHKEIKKLCWYGLKPQEYLNRY